MKPQIEIDIFARLDLRVGTVVGIRPVESLPNLIAITVQIDERVEALSPASTADEVSLGSQVVVAARLHPLTVCEFRFTAFLLTEISSEVPIPNGSRVS